MRIAALWMSLVLVISCPTTDAADFPDMQRIELSDGRRMTGQVKEISKELITVYFPEDRISDVSGQSIAAFEKEWKAGITGKLTGDAADGSDILPQIRLAGGASIRAKVSWIDKDGLYVLVPRQDVQRIDDVPVAKFKGRLKKLKTVRAERNKAALEEHIAQRQARHAEWIKDVAMAGQHAPELYRQVMQDRARDIDVEMEWNYIEQLREWLNDLSPRSISKPSAEFTRDHVYRKLSDGNKQTIIEFLQLNEIQFTRTQFLLHKDDCDCYSMVTFSQRPILAWNQEQLEEMLGDSDGDGLSDKAERCEDKNVSYSGPEGEERACRPTDPARADSDGDGWWDSFEWAMHSDPLDSDSLPDTKRFEHAPDEFPDTRPGS